MNYPRCKLSVLMSLALLLIALVACQSGPKNTSIILATTTSTQDSGLLDALLPIFEEQTGYVVKTIAVGTGQALKMGEEGNADVLMVHAPASEIEFMDNGFGVDRLLVMHNDFVIVGPKEDPAQVQTATSIVAAFEKMASAQAVFVSRGDDSGTHKKELAIWKEANIAPSGNWYIESGQGMGATLKIASEKDAYTLTDRATYFANLEILDLVILFEGDPQLLNVYHVIAVNPEKWPNVNREGAAAFSEFLVSDQGQAIIAEFGLVKFGQPLFFPDAGKDEAELGLP